MGDPLSVASGVAGIISLGLTVCSGLLDYYGAWKEQPSETSAMCESLEALGKIFRLLEQRVRHPLLDADSVERVTESIIACAASVQGLRSKLDKIRNVKPGMSARLQRAQYPFQEKTILKLLRTISDLRSNLSLATSTLQLDVSISSLDRVDRLNTNIKDLIDNSNVSSTKILDGISKVHFSQEQEKLRALNSEERDLMSWLSPLDFTSKQSDALSRRQVGTGRWLLESDKFRSWLKSAGRVLWCPGMPGAGKTVLASTVIDHLKQERRGQKTGIAYVYCVHNGADQTASNFLGSLLRQLTMQSAAILKDLKLCHKHHIRLGTRPSTDELARLLRLQVEEFEEVFLVVDALDECPERDQTRKTLVAEMRGLLPKISFLVTSRNMPSIEMMFKHDMRLEIRAQDQDIRKFINSQMEQRDGLVDLLEGHNDVRSSIVTTVLEKTNGMFLIAALHMDSLAKEDNIRELKESLQSLPRDLDKTYDDALERIKQQDARKLARADQILTLTICAKRPLKLEEMRQALSIRPGDTFLDPEAFPKTDSLISTCCGLVVVEDGSQVVRLVHYTTEEYFKRKHQRFRNPEAHAYFAVTLVTYLSFTTFGTFSPDKVIGDAMDQAATRDAEISIGRTEKQDAIQDYMDALLERSVLLQYAAENWGHHTREALIYITHHPDPGIANVDPHSGKADNQWNLKQVVKSFVQKDRNVAFANGVFHYVEKDRQRFSSAYEFRAPTNTRSLHITALLGLQYFVQYYLDQGSEIDARDPMGMTALHKAAKYGHEDVVRLLLDGGAAVGIRDQWGYSALVWAVRANQVSVARVLLENGADPGFKTERDSSAVTIAARFGHEEILELLIEYWPDDVSKNQNILDVFNHAASIGLHGIVRLLLRGGEEWHFSEEDLARAMNIAASEGHVTTMKVLLDAGVNVNSPSSSLGRESLHEAAQRGHSEAVRLLLTAGADPDIMTEGGELPLHAGARNGHLVTVAVLLEQGADVNALNSKGETAMLVIAGPKHGFLARSRTLPMDSVPIMQMLLEHGANKAATDPHSNRTSLEYAIFRGHKGLVQLLLQFETFDETQKTLMLYLTDIYKKIGEGSTNDETLNQFLHKKEAQNLSSISSLLLPPLPAEFGHDRIVLTFLHSNADIEAENLQGNTALQMSAWLGHIATVQLLLQHGAAIDSKGSATATPLIMAAEKGHTDIVQLLLEHGADLNASSTDPSGGRTALAQALRGKHTATAKALLEKGADANAKFNPRSASTLLHIVAGYSFSETQLPTLNLLLAHGADLEAKDKNGQTPLVIAICRSQRVETVRYLLDRGADLHVRDKYGRTPLVVAVQKHGSESIVALLLEKGADVEAKDYVHGRTALMVAAKESRPGALRLLLEKGASLEKRDDKGDTALVIAAWEGKVENVEFLLGRGADPRALSLDDVVVGDDWVPGFNVERALELVLDWNVDDDD